MVFLSLILFAFFVVALVDIILRRDDQVKLLPKIVWIFVVILLPLLGSILWFAIGREYSPAARPRQVIRMPRAEAGASAAPRPAASTAHLSTEEQLAALEREIEYYDREQRIRRLEEELKRRRDDDAPPA